MTAQHTMENKILQVMFSSKTPVWSTPQDLFNTLDSVFKFDLDVCALHSNAKTARFFTPEQDGLTQDWGKSICFMNPPYGRQIGNWIAKAFNSAKCGAIVVCLLPARTDTKWWHDYVSQSIWTELLKGRLRFGDSKNTAPFPSAVVVFAPDGYTMPFTPAKGGLTGRGLIHQTAEVKRLRMCLAHHRRILAMTICESKLCFTCDTDAEHCKEVREEMQRRFADAKK